MDSESRRLEYSTILRRHIERLKRHQPGAWVGAMKIDVQSASVVIDVTEDSEARG